MQAACELSRTEARAKGDKEDAAREKEEERLWNEGRVAKEETPKKSESSNPKTLPLPRYGFFAKIYTFVENSLSSIVKARALRNEQNFRLRQVSNPFPISFTERNFEQHRCCVVS